MIHIKVFGYLSKVQKTYRQYRWDRSTHILCSREGKFCCL